MEVTKNHKVGFIRLVLYVLTVILAFIVVFSFEDLTGIEIKKGWFTISLVLVGLSINLLIDSLVVKNIKRNKLTTSRASMELSDIEERISFYQKKIIDLEEEKKKIQRLI